MSDDPTANLGLPLIQSAQAQKHVTHNEALQILDTLVQLAVLDRDLTSPPGSPDEGERWIVAAGPSGAWSGHADHIAAWQDGAWQFSIPKTGWIAFVVDEGALIAWDGTAWQPALDVLGGGAAQNLALLGVGTTADATNPFSAKLNNALWVAKTAAEGGDGHLRYKLSKEAAAKTASLLFQDSFSGRAEIGLTGDDDFHFKTSPDGSAWTDALVIDRSTGGVRFLADEASVASAATCDVGSATSLKVAITGTTTITSLGAAPYRLKLVRFAGALTLTHNATTLILPGGANIAAAAGDTAIFASDSSGNWRCLSYQSAAGIFNPFDAVPHCGRLTYVSATAIKFAPFNGDRLKINGAIYAIPSAGIAGVANTSVFVNGTGGQNLGASTVYYVYAFLNSGVVTADFSTTAHAASASAGNIGTEIKSGDDTRTYLGMIRTDGSSQFVDSATQRFVISWFNKRNIALLGANTLGATITSTSDVEIASAARIEFLTEADDAVFAGLTGFAFNNTADAQCHTNIGFDGTTAVSAANSVQQQHNANDFVPAGVAVNKTVAIGYHYATAIGHVNTGTGTWFVALSGMIRG